MFSPFCPPRRKQSCRPVATPYGATWQKKQASFTTTVTLMGFRCLTEYSENNLGPFWLRPTRHAVQRLPGTQFFSCHNSQRSSGPSHRLACPSRAFTGNSPVSIPPHGEPRLGLSTTFLSVHRSSAHTAVSAINDGVCHIPPKLAHSVSTLSTNWPQATYTTHRVYFTPTTLMSFYLQGLTTQRLESVSRLHPPMPFLLSGEPENPRLRRLIPSAKRYFPTPVASRR